MSLCEQLQLSVFVCVHVHMLVHMPKEHDQEKQVVGSKRLSPYMMCFKVIQDSRQELLRVCGALTVAREGFCERAQTEHGSGTYKN